MPKYASNYSLADIIICQKAKAFQGEVLVSASTWDSLLAALLAKRTHAPGLMIMGGQFQQWEPLISHLVPTLSPLVPDPADAEAEIGIVTILDMLTSGRWLLWMSPAQIDRRGNVNITCIGDWHRPTVWLHGSRAVADNTVNNNNVFFHVPNHNRRSFVEKVDFISGVGYNEARDRGEVRWGAPKTVLSDLGVFDFETPDHRMRLQSTHPGVTVERVIENTGFELAIPEAVPDTEPPTEEQMAILDELDVLGCRRLFQASGAGAGAVAADILKKEADMFPHLFPLAY